MSMALLETIAKQQQASILALEHLTMATKSVTEIEGITPKKKRDIGMHIEQAQSRLRQAITLSGDVLANTHPEEQSR